MGQIQYEVERPWRKSTSSSSRNKIQGFRTTWETSFFITTIQILGLFWVAWGFRLFGIVLGCLGWLGGTPPLFHSLWLFSRFTVMLLHYANSRDIIPQLPCATAVLPKEPGKHNWVLRNWQWMKVKLSLLCSKVLSEHAVPINVFFAVPHARDSRGYTAATLDKGQNKIEIIMTSANQPAFSPSFL